MQTNIGTLDCRGQICGMIFDEKIIIREVVRNGKHARTMCSDGFDEMTINWRLEGTGKIKEKGLRVPLFSWFPCYWKFSCAKISAFSLSSAHFWHFNLISYRFSLFLVCGFSHLCKEIKRNLLWQPSSCHVWRSVIIPPQIFCTWAYQAISLFVSYRMSHLHRLSCGESHGNDILWRSRREWSCHLWRDESLSPYVTVNISVQIKGKCQVVWWITLSWNLVICRTFLLYVNIKHTTCKYPKVRSFNR